MKANEEARPIICLLDTMAENEAKEKAIAELRAARTMSRIISHEDINDMVSALRKCKYSNGEAVFDITRDHTANTVVVKHIISDIEVLRAIGSRLQRYITTMKENLFD